RRSRSSGSPARLQPAYWPVVGAWLRILPGPPHLAPARPRRPGGSRAWVEVARRPHRSRGSVRLKVSKDYSCWYNMHLEYMEAGPPTRRPPPGHTYALRAAAVRQVDGVPAWVLPAGRP